MQSLFSQLGESAADLFNRNVIGINPEITGEIIPPLSSEQEELFSRHSLLPSEPLSNEAILATLENARKELLERPGNILEITNRVANQLGSEVEEIFPEITSSAEEIISDTGLPELPILPGLEDEKIVPQLKPLVDRLLEFQETNPDDGRIRRGIEMLIEVNNEFLETGDFGRRLISLEELLGVNLPNIGELLSPESEIIEPIILTPTQAETRSDVEEKLTQPIESDPEIFIQEEPDIFSPEDAFSGFSTPISEIDELDFTTQLFNRPVLPRSEEIDRREALNELNLSIEHISELGILGNEFKTPDFNKDLVKESLEATVLNQPLEARGERFKSVIEAGIESALSSDSPLLNMRRVIATIGQVANEIEEEGGLNDLQPGEIQDLSDFLNEIVKEVFNFNRLTQLEGRIFQPVDISTLIDQFFVESKDVLNLQNRALTLNEIQSIRRDFQQELSELREGINSSNEFELATRRDPDIGESTRKEIFSFNINLLDRLRDYVNEHVENDQLRRLLTSDITVQIQNDRRELGINLANPAPIVQPLGLFQDKQMTRFVEKSIINVLEPVLIRLQNRFNEIEDWEGESRIANRQRDHLLSLLNELADRYNRVAERNNIRASDGRLLLVPTQTEESDRAWPEALGIEQLFQNLERVRDTVRRQAISQITYVPRKIMNQSTGLTNEQIIMDLTNMDREIRTLMRMRKKGIISTVGKRSNLKNILINRGRRRIIGVTSVTGLPIKGAEMREIVFPTNITIEGLTKIANMIIMEDGSLESDSGRPLLRIKRGVTTIQEVVKEIMHQQHQNNGAKFSLIFIPSNPVGGNFIDGSLMSIFKNKSLTPMLINSNPMMFTGGNIFGKIFNTVGNIAKGIASVPLVVASSVFGGSLQPNPRMSANKIFNTGSNIIGSRMNSSGFVSHQPVKFGSIANPRFSWLDVPVKSLTYF